MKITNNGNDTIHHITSCAHSAINNLCTKIKKLWDQLVQLFTLATNNHKLEQKVTLPDKDKEAKDKEAIVVTWTFEKPRVIASKANQPFTMENISKEIDVCHEPIYEEIPAAKGLFLRKEETIYAVPTSNRPVKTEEPIYDVPTNNSPVDIRVSDNDELVLEENESSGVENITRLIADLESFLNNAKKSMSPKLSIFEGSEISI